MTVINWMTPQAFWLLGFLVLWFQNRPALKVPSLNQKSALQIIFWRKNLGPILTALGFVLLVTALARPQIAIQPHEREGEGVPLMLILDTSSSMKALDFKINQQIVNRLDVIKNVVSEFINQRPTDLFGLVVFGSTAFTQCPLTHDHKMIQTYLDRLTIGMAGEDTAIGDALAVGLKRLRQSTGQSRVMILLTDGDNTAGKISPELAAEWAREENIKIYTIAIGHSGLVPIPVQTLLGERIIERELTYDKPLLKSIAERTNGEFFEASNREELKQIYNKIDQLERAKYEQPTPLGYQEFYFYFFIPGVLFWLFGVFYNQFWGLRFP